MNTFGLAEEEASDPMGEKMWQAITQRTHVNIFGFKKYRKIL